MTQASRDGNFVTSLIGVSSADLTTPTPVAVNPTTGALIIDSTSLYASLDDRYVDVDGDTMTGALTLSGAPTAALHATTKEYVDLAVSSFSIDYFLTDTASDIGTYYVMQDTETGEAESTLVASSLSNGDDQLMFTYATPSGEPGLTNIQQGIYQLHTHLEKTAGTKPVTAYWTLSKRATGGAETLLMTSETSSAVTSKASFFLHAVLSSSTVLASTDRLVLKVYANVGTTGNDVDVTIYMEGDNDCHVSVKVPSTILSDLFVRRDGTKELTANWDAGAFEIRAATFESDIATGTAPLTVASVTLVSNLNADLLDSQQGSYYLDSSNFTGTDWSDLTDSGDTTLHDHDGISENTTHRGSDGSDHTFIDQDVTSGSTPTFTGTNITGIDISAGTNLAGGSGITLNDDTADLDINSLSVATIAAGDFVPFWDITATATNKKITFANFEGSLNHDSLTGFVANEHIDHTGVTLTAGTGLTGGGDISSNRSFAVDINGTADLAAPAVGDELLISDADDSDTVKKADLASIVNLADHDQLTNFDANEHFTQANITAVGTIASGTWEATDVGISYGGTGQSTAQAAIDALTQVSAATNEHVLTKDTASGNAIWKVTAGAGGGATTALDNLASVAINLSLVSDTDITDDLGTGDIRWKDIHAATLNSGLTATDTLKLRGRDVDGSAYVDILTITSANTVTADLNAIVTIGGNAILDATSTVSALTTVGTIDTGTWEGDIIDHERGGIEADISAIADGGILVGTGAGAMGIRASALTAGAAGFFKHEVGGLEADVSAYAGLVHITGGSTSAKTIGIADDNIVEIDDADAASGDYAKFTANGLEGRSKAEMLSDLNVADGADVTGSNAPQAHKDSHDPNDGSDALDTANAAEIVGVQAAGTGTSHSFARADHAHQIQHGIANNHLVTVDDADAADDDYAKFTADGLEGRSAAEAKTDLGFITDLVDDTSPQLGGDLDLNDKYIQLKFEPTSDDTGSGIIISATVDSNSTGVGCPLYMAADGHFDEADADAVSTAPCVAIALETGTGTKKVLLSGLIRNDGWNFTTGPGELGLVFLSTTVGTLTQTAPSGTDDVVQVVGFALSDDVLYFSPQLHLIEHTG